MPLGTAQHRLALPGSAEDCRGASGTVRDRQGPSGTVGDRRGSSGTIGDRRPPSGIFGDRRGPSGILGDPRENRTSRRSCEMCVNFRPSRKLRTARLPALFCLLLCLKPKWVTCGRRPSIGREPRPPFDAVSVIFANQPQEAVHIDRCRGAPVVRSRGSTSSLGRPSLSGSFSTGIGRTVANPMTIRTAGLNSIEPAPQMRCGGRLRTR